jgi:hypothetical protein
MHVRQNGPADQTLGVLGEQAQALLELVADLKRQVDAVERAQAQARTCTNGPLSSNCNRPRSRSGRARPPQGRT